ncbi:hypothetical protein BKA62DRAFT_712303 [Auriculariales sp. MPI-PUGE-AT-0066]|nr:hypothetical protein BKA62DRAFT_712303 [Auriculariales sp. MPI-PUGE-AT-0066]
MKHLRDEWTAPGVSASIGQIPTTAAAQMSSNAQMQTPSTTISLDDVDLVGCGGSRCVKMETLFRVEIQAARDKEEVLARALRHTEQRCLQAERHLMTTQYDLDSLRAYTKMDLIDTGKLVSMLDVLDSCMDKLAHIMLERIEDEEDNHFSNSKVASLNCSVLPAIEPLLSFCGRFPCELVNIFAVVIKAAIYGLFEELIFNPFIVSQSGTTPHQGFDSTYEVISRTQVQAVCGRWRQATYNSFVPTLPQDDTALVTSISDKVLSTIDSIFSGCDIAVEFATFAFSPHVRSLVAEMVKIALGWHALARGQYTAADYSPFMPPSGTAFNAKSMTHNSVSEFDQHIPTHDPRAVVVATVCPGIQAECSIRDEKGSIIRVVTVFRPAEVVIDIPQSC